MHKVTLLGGLRIHSAGDPDEGHAVQLSRMALFAALALSRTRAATREQLMSLLWPESDTDRARHLLREYAYRLRKSLGEDVVIGSGPELRLDTTRITCDLWEFEAACARCDWESADHLYGGPLLAGVFLSDAVEFERLVEAERARFAALHAQALESLASERAERGDWVGVAALWRRRATAEPFNARIALQLMEALEASGDRAEALKHAETHTALLQAELGAAPDPAVVELAERLRTRPTNGGNGHTVHNGRNGGHGDDARDHQTRDSVPRSTTDAGVEPAPLAAVRRQAAAETSPVPGAQADARTIARRRATVGVVAALGTLVAAVALLAVVVGSATPLDANRIVIVPARSSGANPGVIALQSDLVELLSLQFTGEVGPVAVDAGEALRAWRDENPGAEPVTPDMARRIARRVHAGQVAIPSVVGAADQLIVSVSILDAGSGATIVSTVQASGPMDRLPSIVEDLSTRLRSRSAGEWRLTDDGVRSINPAAQLAYLRGRVAYKSADWVRAGTELYRAVELDSNFAQAAYRFAIIHAMLAPTTPFGTAPSGPEHARFSRLYRRLWAEQHQLSAEQRLLLQAVADTNGVLWRQVALPRLELAVRPLQHSVEAWDLLGESYFHAGALTGHADWAERATEAFLHARALDSTIAVNAAQHLADLAFLARDAGALQRFAATARGPRNVEYYRYQATAVYGAADERRAARIRYAQAWARSEAAGLDWAFHGITASQVELDSLLEQFAQAAASPEQVASVEQWALQAAMLGGRPAQGTRLLRRLNGPDSVEFYRALLDYAAEDLEATEWLDVAEARAQAGMKLRPGDHPTRCNVALARLRHGDSSGAGALLAVLPKLDDRRPAEEVVSTIRRGPVGQGAMCGQVLRAVLHASSASGVAMLLRTDSLMQHTTLNYGDFWNYDLALALARQGKYGAAAAAVRRHLVDVELVPEPRLAISLRQEGRWAALAGDTASAITAYHHYLVWRESPEPAAVPQRDSVRRELSALSQGRWRGWEPESGLRRALRGEGWGR